MNRPEDPGSPQVPGQEPQPGAETPASNKAAWHPAEILAGLLPDGAAAGLVAPRPPEDSPEGRAKTQLRHYIAALKAGPLPSEMALEIADYLGRLEEAPAAALHAIAIAAGLAPGAGRPAEIERDWKIALDIEQTRARFSAAKAKQAEWEIKGAWGVKRTAQLEALAKCKASPWWHWWVAVQLHHYRRDFPDLTEFELSQKISEELRESVQHIAPE